LWIGFSLLWFGLPVALLSGRGGALADRFGPLRVASVAVVLVFGATAIYGWMPTPGLIAGVGAIEGIGMAALGPSVLAMLVLACPPGRLGGGQSLALAGNELAAATGAFFGPAFYGRFGSGTIFTVAVAVMALCWAGGVALYRSGDAQPGAGGVTS
jgi:MFS family permease